MNLYDDEIEALKKNTRKYVFGKIRAIIGLELMFVVLLFINLSSKYREEGEEFVIIPFMVLFLLFLFHHLFLLKVDIDKYTPVIGTVVRQNKQFHRQIFSKYLIIVPSDGSDNLYLSYSIFKEFDKEDLGSLKVGDKVRLLLPEKNIWINRPFFCLKVSRKYLKDTDDFIFWPT